MIRPSALTAGLTPYAPAGPPEGLVSLAQNESAFPPAPAALEAGRAALAEAALYPDPEWRGLRAAAAEIHGLDPENILCGAGSMELINCLMRAFAGPGGAVLAPQYSYLYAAAAARQAGARYDTAPEQDFTVSVDALSAAVRPETRIVFVCNPGNPTGTRIANAEIVRLRGNLADDVLLIIDQAYAEFDGQDHGPVFDLIRRGNTAVTRTFSKAYGLAGARAGWGVFPPAVAAEVRKILNPNNVSAAGQAMAAAAAREQDYMRGVTEKTAAVRGDFTARLRAAGYAPPESRTNFVLIPFAGAQAAARADAALRENGVFLRGMSGYGLAHCLRATAGGEDVMARCAAVLADMQENAA